MLRKLAQVHDPVDWVSLCKGRKRRGSRTEPAETGPNF